MTVEGLMPGAPWATKNVSVTHVQYDGDGKWIDVTFSSGPTYRLDALFLVKSVVKALRDQDQDVGLCTPSGVLRWGKEHAEKV